MITLFRAVTVSPLRLALRLITRDGERFCFVFGKGSLVGDRGSVMFGSSLMELDRCFRGGHLLRINCKYVSTG